jgi:penicillin-binding protein 2
VAIGQGAVEATPLQLARIIGGIASGGHLVRPHVVFPDQLPADFRKSLLDSFPGSGDTYVSIDPENWTIITDGMAEVTEPGLYHTAGSSHLEGIDFAGKTGTAQQMSHEALEKTGKGKSTYPNVWFVGLVPRRNPELVVAVLWQQGEFSYYPARIGAKVVEAYVDKKRRLAHNLPPPKATQPVEVGAVWSVPGSPSGAKNTAAAHIQGGHFFVENGHIVAANDPAAKPAARQGTNPHPSSVNGP